MCNIETHAPDKLFILTIQIPAIQNRLLFEKLLRETSKQLGRTRTAVL